MQRFVRARSARVARAIAIAPRIPWVALARVAAYAALYFNAADSNTVTGSYIQNPAGYGARLFTGSDYNTISLSTMIGNVNSGLYALTAASNTVTQSYMQGGLNGTRLKTSANYNTISLSTMVSNSVGNPALYVVQSASNTIANSFIQAGQGEAAILSLAVNTDGLLTRFNAGVCADDDSRRFIEAARELFRDATLRRGKQLGAARFVAEWHDNDRNVDAFLAGLPK